MVLLSRIQRSTFLKWQSVVLDNILHLHIEAIVTSYWLSHVNFDEYCRSLWMLRTNTTSKIIQTSCHIILITSCTKFKLFWKDRYTRLCYVWLWTFLFFYSWHHFMQNFNRSFSKAGTIEQMNIIESCLARYKLFLWPFLGKRFIVFRIKPLRVSMYASIPKCRGSLWVASFYLLKSSARTLSNRK